MLRWYLGVVGGVPAALGSLGAVAFHAVLSQAAPRWQSFGWTSFGVAVVAVLVNLAAAMALRILERRWSASWFLVHGGLLLAIGAALLGALTAVRGKFVLHEGEAASRVVDADGRFLAHLPFGVLLQDFQMEEGEPTLTLVDSGAREIVFRKGEPIHELRREARGTLRGIGFEVVAYLPHAELDHDTVRAALDTFCPPAAWLRYRTGGAERRGWITCGGRGIPTLTQPAGSVRLAMALPPAKHFRSVVTLLKKGEAPREAVIEVNRGVMREGWTLQQLDYDKVAGRASRLSILEAVRDPFAPGVKAGIVLALAGIVFFALAEGRRNP